MPGCGASDAMGAVEYDPASARRLAGLIRRVVQLGPERALALAVQLERMADVLDD